jgi:hypothetical protein
LQGWLSFEAVASKLSAHVYCFHLVLGWFLFELNLHFNASIIIMNRTQLWRYGAEKRFTISRNMRGYEKNRIRMAAAFCTQQPLTSN